jgi:hypothetical protein
MRPSDGKPTLQAVAERFINATALLAGNQGRNVLSNNEDFRLECSSPFAGNQVTSTNGDKSEASKGGPSECNMLLAHVFKREIWAECHS